MRTQRERLLDVVHVVAFDRHAAKASAEVRVALEKRGQPIGPVDTLIAGTALACQATLVTRNTREFRRVDGLLVEDWFGVPTA